MPIYEYVCEACKAKFDQLARSMSASNDKSDRPKCPACGSVRTSRALSVFAVASDTGKSSSGGSDVPTCGRCGGAPGSCQM